jgi:sulfur-carrier protein
MQIKVMYFARLREQLGKESETLTLPGGGWTVARLREHLCAAGDPYAQALRAGSSVKAAVNQVMTGDSAAIEDGAEVAFFPPVTGG